jgi:hypothetical protein
MLGIDYRRPIQLPAQAAFKDVGRDLELSPDMGEPQDVVLLTLGNFALRSGERVCVNVLAATDKNSNPTALLPEELRRYELVGIIDSTGELHPLMSVDSNLPNLFARVLTPFK